MRSQISSNARGRLIGWKTSIGLLRGVRANELPVVANGTTNKLFGSGREEAMIGPGIHRFLMTERVVHGRPAAAVLAEEGDRLQRPRGVVANHPAPADSTLLGRVAAGRPERP